MNRRTVVVEGPLAFRMRRLAAARGSEAGLQILTLPLLAARLAGGFRRPARSQDVEPAIRLALDAPGFAELEATREKLRLLEERYQANQREQGGDEHVRELSMRSLKQLINQLKEEIARFESRSSLRTKTR